jgi:hypothetical protein
LIIYVLKQKKTSFMNIQYAKNKIKFKPLKKLSAELTHQKNNLKV